MKKICRHPKLINAMLLAALALAVSLPLYCNGLFNPNPGHDLEFHLQRIIGLSQAIQIGQLPCQIQPWWIRGMGYAVSAFYPDLFLYPSAVLYLAGMSLQNAYKLMLAGINVASVFLAYWSFKKIFGRNSIAWLGTILYILAPYRLTDIYLRSAIGEALSMVFLPLCAESIHSIFESDGTDRGAWKRMAIAYAGICCSHALSLFIVGLFTAMYCIFRIRHTIRKNVFLSLLKGTLMAILLSLWFLIPLLEFSSSSKLYMNEMYRDVYPEAVYYWQMLIPFSPSYGGSIHLGYGTKGEMPFYLGWPLLSGFLILLIRKFRKKQNGNGELVTVTAMALIGMWMCSSLFPYNQLNHYHLTAYLVNKVQYPWRFEMAVTILLSLLVMAAVSKIEEKTYKKVFKAIAALAVLQGSAYLASFMYHASIRMVESADDLWSGNYMGGEFLQAAHFDDSLQEKSLVPYAYDAEILSYSKSGLKASVTIKNPTDKIQKLILPLTYYPEYRAYDTKTLQSMQFYNSGDGRLTVIVPAGYSGTVAVSYTVLPLYRILAVLCTAALFLLIASMTGKFRRNPVKLSKTVSESEGSCEF
ncbi:MAG: hypothetical protein EOM64_03245 [Erysipelotrichia bacterium]|nr:hypothetical protein [Erysipelotrichia bacterium]